jgi:hypothetical protein
MTASNMSVRAPGGLKSRTLPARFNVPQKKAITEQVTRYVSANKRLVPYFIPLTGRSWNGAKDARGRKPFILPLPAGRMLKFPILVPADSNFRFHDIRVVAYRRFSGVGFSSVYRRKFSASRFSPDKYIQGTGTVNLTNLSDAGSDPDVSRDLARLFPSAGSWRVIITPLDGSFNPVEKRLRATGGAAFRLFELDGTTSYAWPGTTGQHWITFAPYLNAGQQEPYANLLRTALYAKSPSNIGLYGNECTCTGIFEPHPAGGNLYRVFPHIERLNVGTLQGVDDGKGQLLTEYLIPRQGSLLFEIENPSDVDLYVNAVIFGYKEFTRVKI